MSPAGDLTRMLEDEELHGEVLIDIDGLRKYINDRMKTAIDLQNAILKTMAELVECRDDVASGHIERTTRYLKVMIGAMIERGMHREKISSYNMETLLLSAQLHDVGKIAVRDNVLQKPGKLTPDEFEEMKRHTIFGEEVIEKIKRSTTDRSFLEYAGVFAATHHEKWDGTGYPRGLRGEEIPLKGRLMAIADVYDALISDRPYKRAFSHEEVVDVIRSGSGTHFDPQLVGLFVDVAGEFDKIYREFGNEKAVT